MNRPCYIQYDADPEEMFDPSKGYPRGVRLDMPEIGRNAFYQGFITEWEFRMIHGMNFLQIVTDDDDRCILRRTFHPESFVVLNRQRMIDIKADKLLGIGGYTSPKFNSLLRLLEPAA